MTRRKAVPRPNITDKKELPQTETAEGEKHDTDKKGKSGSGHHGGGGGVEWVTELEH
jgi:hypothetical protein